MFSVLVDAELFLRVPVTLYIPSCDSGTTNVSAVQPPLGFAAIYVESIYSVVQRGPLRVSLTFP